MKMSTTKLKILSSQKKHLKALHEAGFINVDYLEPYNNVTLYSAKLSYCKNKVNFTELNILNFYGGIVYKTIQNKKEFMLLLTGNLEYDKKFIKTFELKNNNLYKSMLRE